ncbi:MAG: Tetracycline resistance protein, class C [Candidatus Heimdallarchaeota archaeon LC_2]|nr:MAG: Tetracycline resistance protein, class C [Candidatus Heimdallarchaeota archaeon LC_2]
MENSHLQIQPEDGKKLKSASLGLLFFAIFIDLFGFGVVIPILPFLARDDLGASGFEYGLIIALYSLMQFIFAPIWGNLSDQYGRRPIILIGLGGSSIGFALFSFSSSLWILYLARAVAGIFTAATLTVANAYISDSTPPDKRGGAFGLIAAAFGLGFALGPAVGGFLAGQEIYGLTGHVLAGIFSALLAVINLIGAIFYLPESLAVENRKISRSIKPQIFSKIEFKRITSYPGISLFFMIFALMSFGFSMLIAAFSVYAPEKDETVDATALGFYFTYVGLILFLSQTFLIKPMIRWFGEETVIKIGIFGIFAGFVALPFAPTFQWMFVTNAPIFFGLSMASPSIISLISRLAPSDEQGSVMGFNQGFASLSRVIGPLIAGIIFDIEIVYPFILGAFIFGIVTVIALIKIKPITPYKNKLEIIN